MRRSKVYTQRTKRVVRAELTACLTCGTRHAKSSKAAGSNSKFRTGVLKRYAATALFCF